MIANAFGLRRRCKNSV